jgi:iron complex transport system ATP-binding protein
VLDEPTAFLDVPSRVELMALLRRLTRDDALAAVMSTHDLELALRTADVIWLVLPGGEMMTGAPEDIVLAGGIARAFEGRQIRFDGEARSFRWLSGESGTAAVRGSGLRAALVRGVLERAGYEVDSHDAELVVEADESGWRTTTSQGPRGGRDFASLAAFLRGRKAA